ncbi:MAG TPA: elongation factor G [Dehalococcoidia bacterium]|nr:elongation factor G [Dehalococcoidia bacterium]
MSDYPPAKTRNLALIGHGGTGKTSLADALLFTAGAVSRLGRVDEGTTASDYEPEEVRHHISLNLSLLPCSWQGHKLNLIDTPGYADFAGEVKSALRAADAVLIVVDAAAGVQVGTDQAWAYADEEGLPKLALINRLDRENADFFRTLEQIQERFGPRCLPLHLPIGTQQAFQGVVELLAMQAQQGDGTGPIPEEMAATAATYREKLIEAAAETEDELTMKYLEGEALTETEVMEGLRSALRQGKLVPVLCASGLKSIGVPLLLDAMVKLLPSPLERPPVVARTPQGGEVPLAGEPQGPLAALAFKTTADPFVGRLTYLRVLSGTLSSNSQVFNANRERQERIGQLFLVRGKSQEPVHQVAAGDIGGVAKLAETQTGDTLTAAERPLLLPGIAFPQPTFSLAVHPKSKADLEKMGSALARIVEEDPSLKLVREHDTAEMVLSGLGDVHLEVAIERIRRKFGVELETSLPKIPYKETITTTTTAEYKHKKQTGGHGQYGHVFLRLEPLPKGSGFQFAEEVVGGAVPKNYIPGVEKGVVEALPEGVLARYPLADLKVILYDGSYHPVDSSEMAFKIAASHALRKGVSQARPVLQEPVMDLRVVVPEANTGDIMGDLNGKRARILGMGPAGKGYTEITAQVPLAEIQRYALDLRSLTQGRATFTAAFSHYEEVPQHVTQKIVEEAQREAKERA